MAGDLRPGRVLHRHQADAQRAPGQSGGPHRRAVGDVAPLQRDERARALARLGRVRRRTTRSRRRSTRSRRRRRAPGCGAATSTSRRRIRRRWSSCLPYVERYGASLFHVDSLRPGRDERRRQRRPAGDRPADAEEHGALARRRRLRVPPVRDRRQPPDDLPGLALRSLEGPAGRDRRVPDRQGRAPGRAARAGRLDGVRRPRGLGLLQRDDRPRRGRSGRPHPQQLQQRRARSRSTRSSRWPTS